MAKQLVIKNGVTTVDLLNLNGFKVLSGGWSPSTSPDLLESQGFVKEKFNMKLTGSSHDDLSSQVIEFNNLLRDAKRFFEAPEQTVPVYLVAQGSGETNPRHSVIRDAIPIKLNSSIQSIFPETGNVFEDVDLTIWRKPAYQADVPGNYPSAETLTANDGPASPTRVHISNVVDQIDLTHIYAFDDSLGTFSANNVASSSFKFFPDPAGDEDIAYFGSTTAAFHNVVLNHVGLSGTLTIIAEYYNGSWTALTLGSQLGLYPEGGTDSWWGSSGFDTNRVFNVSNVNDWVKTTINGVNAYWIRFRIDTFSSLTETGQADQVVYTQKNNYIEIPSGTIAGDFSPLLLMAFANGEGAGLLPNFMHPSRIICGFKSRGISGSNQFQSMVSLAIDTGNAAITPSWSGSSQALASGVTNVVDPDGPGGFVVNVAFSTDATLLTERVSINSNDTESYLGEYRMFARVQQIGGSDNDISIQLELVVEDGTTLTSSDYSIVTEEVALRTQDAGIELVDLGIMRFAPDNIIDSDNHNYNPRLIFNAKRASGSATLKVYGVDFMPVDEAAFVINAQVDQTDDIGPTFTGSKQAIELDSGVVMKRLIKNVDGDGSVTTLTNKGPVSNWELLGEYPEIEPATAYRLYFIIANYNTSAFGTGPFFAEIGSHLAFEFRKSDQFLSLRGGV